MIGNYGPNITSLATHIAAGDQLFEPVPARIVKVVTSYRRWRKSSPSSCRMGFRWDIAPGSL